jgi:hypothetical protein
MSLSETDGIVLNIRVVPRASRSEIVGLHDGALKIRIAAPPVDGAANAELIKILANTFNVAKSNVEIISGVASKTKQCRIRGITSSQIEAVLKGKT